MRKKLIELLYQPFLQHKIDKLSDTGDIADHLYCQRRNDPEVDSCDG